MYEELVKRLHRCAAEAAIVTDEELMIVAREAAAAIEELQAKFTAEHDLRVKALNRLCSWCGVCSKENRDAVGCDDIAQLDEVHAPRWISVEEALPDMADSDWVIGIANGTVGCCTLEQAVVMVAYEPEENEWYLESDPEISVEVTHWMPLPEPPKEEP